MGTRHLTRTGPHPFFCELLYCFDFETSFPGLRFFSSPVWIFLTPRYLWVRNGMERINWGHYLCYLPVVFWAFLSCS